MVQAEERRRELQAEAMEAQHEVLAQLMRSLAERDSDGASRQELADLTGTTIETAIRIMSRWGKQRIVLTEKDGFLLVDRKALEALAAA